MTWILMVSIWSGQILWGMDFVPTTEFKNEKKCLEMVAELKSKNKNSQAYCYKMEARHANAD